MNERMRKLQVNVDMGRKVNDVTQAVVDKLSVYVVCSQEPNRRVVERRNWVSDEVGYMTVWITNRKTEMKEIKCI